VGTAISIDSDMDVGIGTTAPSQELHISKSQAGATRILIENANTGSSSDAGIQILDAATLSNGFLLRVTNDLGARIENTENAYMAFFTNGAEMMRILAGGNVGIGTPSPGYKLDVASGGATTARFGTAGSDNVIIGGGSGKLDVGTIDPVYTINGKSYATFMAGMIGVKEEVTGTLQIECSDSQCKHVINFEDEQEGSDLWLFSKTTNLKENFDELAIMLTPSFEGQVWYEKNAAEKKITIFANPKEETLNTEFSYRLTAPRFDADEWSNIREDSDVKGFIIND